MPQLADVPDHGLVSFPDGMDDTQIADAIKSNSASATPVPPGPVSDGTQITPEPTAIGESLAGHPGKALSLGIEGLRQMLSPLLGPTAAQKTFDAVQMGTNGDGTSRYEYKPLGDEPAKRGLVPSIVDAGKAMLDLPTGINLEMQGLPHTLTNVDTEEAAQMLKPDASDSHTVAVLKAAHNTLLGLSHSANPVFMKLPDSRLLTGAFGGKMVYDANESVKKAINAKTPQETIEGVLGAFLNMGLGVASLAHATSPSEISPAAVEQPTMEPAPNVVKGKAPAEAGQAPGETTTTTEIGTPSPTVEGQRMMGNMQPRAEQPIIGEPAMKMTGDESGALNLQLLKDAVDKIKAIPGVKDYADGWKHRVQEFGKHVDAFKRMRESKDQRDMIPALYDAAETQAGYIADQARNGVTRTNRDPIAQQAATFVAQAAGDRPTMEAKLNAIRGQGYDPVIDYALAHWDNLQPIVDRAAESTDATHAAATGAGINLDYREGYVEGAYEDTYDPANQKVVFFEPKGGGGVGSAFTKQKVFDSYADAIAADYKPRTLRLDDLTQSAVLNTMRKVNRKEWVQSLGNMTMPDGSPVVVPMAPGTQAPTGYKSIQVEPGILTAVHEEVAPLVRALTTPSAFPKILSQFTSSVKHNKLAFDIFHGSRFAQMQMAFQRQLSPSYRRGLAIMENTDADLAKGVASGEVTQEQADYARENRPIVEAGIAAGANIGKISDAIYKDIAPLLPYAKTTSHFIFDKLSRGIIAESYVYAFKRNLGFHPEMTEAQVHRYTAKEINTYYRNLGNQGFFKSKTFQDISRFLFLAPQWFEGGLRSEARGYGQAAKAVVTLKKPGNISAAMGTGLVAYFAVNQLINMMTRGQPTWENPEPGHKLDAWLPDPGGSNGQFIAPTSVFAENTHDINKFMDRGVQAMDVVGELGSMKVAPLPRAGWDIVTGRNIFGQKMLGYDRFVQATKDVAPLPIGLTAQHTPGSRERSLLGFAGIKAVGAGSASTNTYKLADQWMKRQGIKRPGAQEGEQGPASIYRPLRQALEVGDMKKARTEYNELKKTTDEDLIDRHFAGLDNVRFTGRKSTEDDFIASLKPKEKRLYDKAILERERIMDRYENLK